MSHYLHILLESFLAATLILGLTEPTLAALRVFGGYNLALAVFLAACGAAAGACTTWLLGRLLNKLREKYPNPKIDRFMVGFRRYAGWVIIFSWVPLGDILLLIAGFCRMELRYFLLLVFTGRLVYYMFLFP